MNETTTPTSDQGLRSVPGIRWLLLAGGLVTGVSVYRLVQARWAVIPVPAQFLILVAGALAIFAAGSITRRRLHLPYAGAALLSLFAGLVPVMAWGAVYLRLLDTPWGWLAFSAGGAALLGAAVGLMRSVLRYPGRLYPAALGLLLAAQPLLPWLGERWTGRPEGLYALAALILGAVLYVGSRHVNRFFFHRDRRDGIDRTVHLMPFLLLGVLYLGALGLLDLRSTSLALPLAVVGIVLAGTGEEYYRALADALGRAPERWPGRSVALLALGFSAVVAAVPLALLDPTLRCLPFTALCAAVLFLRWSLRYEHRIAHVLGVAAAFIAYHSSPALAPGLAREAKLWLAALLGFSPGSPAVVGWGDIGFLALLILFGALLARRQAPEGIQRTHGALTALQLLAIAALALGDVASAPPLLAVALALTLLGVKAARRIEPVVAGQFTLAVLAFAAVRTFLGLGMLPALCAVGIVVLALAVASPFCERLLAQETGSGIEKAREALLLPGLALAAMIAMIAAQAAFGLHPTPLTGIAGMLAGAVWMVAGYRLRRPSAFTAGCLLLSLGGHVALLLRLGGVTPWTALLTAGCFALSWMALRQSREGGRIDLSVREGLRVFTLLNAALGAVWLVHAAALSRVTVEPLILLLAGLAGLWEGFKDRQDERIDLGMILAVAWAPLQIFFAGGFHTWSAALIAALGGAGLELAALTISARRAPGRWLARRCGMEPDDLQVLAALSLRPLIRIWLALAAAACLLFAGFDALLLALGMTVILFLCRTGIEGWAPRLAFPARLTLLPLLQLAVLIAASGHPQRDLPMAILYLNFAVLPWMAALGLAWRGLIEVLGRRHSLGPWAVALELLTGLGYVATFLLGNAFSAGFSTGASALLIALAAGWAAVSVLDGVRDEAPGYGVSAQIWAGLAVLHGFTAGWLHLGSGVAPYVLLIVGVAEYVLAAWLQREELGPAFLPSSRALGLSLPLAAGALALLRPGGGMVWLPALAAFLASLFYTVAASREPRRVFPALASAAFLGLGLLKVVVVAQLGMELCFLAPGLALLALAWLLRAELGPVWSRHLAAAGASCVYATPIVALSGAVSWGWLAALLVMAVAFGAASFAVRSRSLLTVSTAALLTDLGFFVFRIGTTAPTVLWVLGLGFGLALMGIAAWLEYQREGVLQQIRVFGRELRAWS